MTRDVILETRGLKRYYASRSGLFLRVSALVRAVDGVDLVIRKGETLGLVGESGCGKSTLARLLLKLERPDSGDVLFKTDPAGDRRAFRRSVQGIFQDPYGTLNPRFTVHQSLEEGLTNLFPRLGRGERGRKIHRALESVGLEDRVLDRFPHEFSGGQRQRIGIARALVLGPAILICDEPVSSLDVSVAAQIIALLRRLKEEQGLTLVIISHHMGIVSALSDEIAVMKEGRIVEQGPRESILRRPRHAYTQKLMAAVPRLEKGR